MIDWSLPLVAVPTREAIEPIPVKVDAEYHRSAGKIPVRFPVNLWIASPQGGTWYFDEHGHSLGGVNERGTNDARFEIRNRAA